MIKYLFIKIAKLIEKNVEGCKITEGKGTDADKRDYEVSYARIKTLGHKTVTVSTNILFEGCDYRIYLCAFFVKGAC